MPNILERIRQESSEIFNQIQDHPFVQQIHEATLSPHHFQYYSEQDDLYLETWAELILKLTNKLKAHPLAEDSEFCSDVTFVEIHLRHVKKMIAAGVFNPKRTEAAFIRPEASPVVESYIRHLQQACTSSSLAVGFASLFGCYDLYRQIGEHSKSMQIAPSHPYYSWLSANYDEEFITTAENVFRITERVAEFELIIGKTDLAAVVASGCQSYRYEWDFFTDVIEEKQLVRGFLR